MNFSNDQRCYAEGITEPIAASTSDKRQLFRRAIVDGDEFAWTELYHQYWRLVAMWVTQQPAFWRSDEKVEYFVNRSFERFYVAVTPTLFCRSLLTMAAIMAYLKKCTCSAIADYARVQPPDEILPLELCEWVLPTSKYQNEAYLYQRYQAKRLWSLLDKMTRNKQESIVLHEGYRLGLKPQEICEQYSAYFGNVQEVYRARENLFRRLRRDDRLKDLLS